MTLNTPNIFQESREQWTRSGLNLRHLRAFSKFLLWSTLRSSAVMCASVKLKDTVNAVSLINAQGMHVTFLASLQAVGHWDKLCFTYLTTFCLFPFAHVKRLIWLTSLKYLLPAMMLVSTGQLGQFWGCNISECKPCYVEATCVIVISDLIYFWWGLLLRFLLEVVNV